MLSLGSVSLGILWTGDESTAGVLQILPLANLHLDFSLTLSPHLFDVRVYAHPQVCKFSCYNCNTACCSWGCVEKVKVQSLLIQKDRGERTCLLKNKCGN